MLKWITKIFYTLYPRNDNKKAFCVKILFAVQWLTTCHYNPSESFWVGFVVQKWITESFFLKFSGVLLYTLISLYDEKKKAFSFYPNKKTLLSFSLALQKTKERKCKSKQRMQNIIVTLQIEIRKKMSKVARRA